MSTMVAIEISDDAYEWIKRLAEENGWSLDHAVNYLLWKYSGA